MFGNTTRGVFGLGPIQYWETAPGVNVPAVSESQVVAPSEMLAMGDALMKVGMKGGLDYWGCVNPFGGELVTAPYVARHGSKDNQVYVDGHVSGRAPRELYDPQKTARLWNYDHRPHEELWKQ
jgi:prepilin-type processing-associated H-X9-DG protein